MRVGQRSFFYGLSFLAIMVLIICWNGMYAQSSTVKAKSLPTINLPILFDSGKRFTNRDLIGNVDLINFWASWCAACQEEHATLLWIHENYPIKMIGINFQDDSDQARAMLLRYGNPYAVVLKDDMGTSAYTLGIDVLPQTFLVDKKGKIRYHHLGVISRRLFESEILPIIQNLEKE